MVKRDELRRVLAEFDYYSKGYEDGRPMLNSGLLWVNDVIKDDELLIETIKNFVMEIAPKWFARIGNNGAPDYDSYSDYLNGVFAFMAEEYDIRDDNGLVDIDAFAGDALALRYANINKRAIEDPDYRETVETFGWDFIVSIVGEEVAEKYFIGWLGNDGGWGSTDYDSSWASITKGEDGQLYYEDDTITEPIDSIQEGIDWATQYVLEKVESAKFHNEISVKQSSRKISKKRGEIIKFANDLMDDDSCQ